MKSTAQNVWRPTAASLRNAFYSSRKRHLLLTGARGSGKTTLLRNFLKLEFPDLCHEDGNTSFICRLPGFTSQAIYSSTEAAPGSTPDHISLYDHTSGTSAVIGQPAFPYSGISAETERSASLHSGASSGMEPSAFSRSEVSAGIGLPATPGCGRMQPVPEGFLGAGLQSLQNALQSDTPFVVLDELGYLEEQIPVFCQALWNVFEKKQVIAVLRDQSLPFLNRLRLREDVFLVDLSAPLPDIGAVLMASGTGSRFVHARKQSPSDDAPNPHKLLCEFHGQPLLAAALNTAASVPWLSPVIAVTRSPKLQALCDSFAFPCLLHSQPLLSDTIRLGLEAIQAQTSAPLDGCFFLQGDQPLLSRESLDAMLLAFQQDPCCIYRLGAEGKPGSPVLFPARLFEELRRLPPDLGGSAVIRRHPGLVRIVEAIAPQELLDVDTPEDLLALNRLFPVL